jgi:thymidylate synthase (FAD)
MKITIISFPKDYRKIIYMAGRNCYGFNCEDINKISEEQLNSFIYKLIENGHESVLEHICITILIEDIPRSLMEQLTRHRLCSYSIKSTHYVNHHNFKFLDFSSTLTSEYTILMKKIQRMYNHYVDDLNIPHYIAREILPNSCLTNIFMTTNIREFRLILNQRLTSNNVPIMQELMRELARQLFWSCPCCFIDIIKKYELEFVGD